MTYIKPAEQRRMADELKKIQPAGIGELQYALTKIVLNFLAPQDGFMTRASIISALGTLEAVQHAVSSRLLHPMDRGDQLTNGDIFQEIIKKSNLRTL